MVTIAAPRAWAFSTPRQRSWMSHVFTAGTWPWRCSRCLLARRGDIPLALPRSSSSGLRRTNSAQGQGDLRITVRASPSSTSPQASHSSSTSQRLVFPDERAGSSDRAEPSISFGAPADDRMSITASGDELGSGEDDSAALPPSGRVALPESDPELTAMLSRAAESIGLLYRLKPPSPERSRLDEWFLGAQAEHRQPPPVPFFPEVHEEVTRSWRAPFSAQNRPSASSVLTTLDGGAAQGYVEIPPVEHAIAMQLCPQGAAAWRGNPRLPSRACRFSSALTAKAYGAAGQAASALHAMALLQVHQAKALKQSVEGNADPGVLQELRTVTDLALRATKVTAWALGQTMSTLAVQERHLWLILADMRESDKHRFLNSPISQTGLFGEAVEDFAQQFSAAQKQTETDVTSCPGGPLLSPPHRRLQPLRLLVAKGALQLPPPPLQLGHNSSLHNGRSMELTAAGSRGYSLGLSGPALTMPLGVRAHSTRGVASSWALARGASIADICKAAGWSTPNTFARFYNLRIEPVSSRVLVSDGQ